MACINKGTPMKRILLAVFTSILLAIALLHPASSSVKADGGIHFVDSRATGGDTGQDWENAFTDLQSALALAQPGEQIWVAEGRYTPGASDRSAAFILPDGVALYGGFAGYETSLSQRELRDHPTLLSGDLAGDDAGEVSTTNPLRSDNAYHVLIIDSAGTTTRLDGFVLQGGNADGMDDDGMGGGLLVKNSAALLANLTFTANSAGLGGGMAVLNASPAPAASNLQFVGNTAAQSGGGLLLSGAWLTAGNLVFSGNHAGEKGGAMLVQGNSRPTFFQASFAGNSAPNGSAAHTAAGAFTDVLNSLFSAGQSMTDEYINSDTHGTTRLNYCLAADAYEDWMNALISHGGSVSYTSNNVVLRLTDPDGADDLPGTLDDDLRPLSTSPALEFGNLNLLLFDSVDLDLDGDTAERTPLDLDGRRRVIGAKPDVGAYESLIATTLTLTSSLNPAPIGQTITLTARVVESSSETPTGLVRFYAGADLLGSTTLDSGGYATLDVSGLSAGVHNLHAAYAGDTQFAASQSSDLQQQINKGAVSLNVSTTPNPSVTGQEVTASAVVSPISGGGAPTGTVVISGSGASCSIDLALSSTCTLTFPGAGSYTFDAHYSGDAGFEAADQTGIAHTISRANTTLNIDSVSPAAPQSGQSATVYFTLSVTTPGAGSPTGEVTVSDGSSHSCSAPAQVGQCSLTFASPGDYSLIATYPEDADYFGSASAVYGVSVVVGDTYADSAGLCAGNAPCFTSISQAVAQAGAGFTVRVYAGTYAEALALNKPVTVRLLGDVTLDGALSLQDGTLILPPGELRVRGDFSHTAGALDTNGGTLTLDAPGDQALRAPQLHHLRLVGAHPAAKRVTLGAPLSLTGDLTLDGASLDVSAASHPLQVTGDWLNPSGAFIPRAGTVTLNGVQQSLSGDNLFYDLEKITPAGQLTLESGKTLTVQHRLTLQGTPTARLVLQPGGAANWQIDPQGVIEIAGLDVRGSTNLALARIRAAATGSLDGGGNTGWNFHQPVLTTSTANATEDTPALITLGATDGDGDSLTCAITSLPAHGKLYQVNPDGTRGGQIDTPGTPVTHSARQVIYLFELDGDAADSFDYAVSDGQYPVTGAVALNRANRNDPPHAAPDSYNLIEDSPLLVSAPAGVLANDSDEDGPSLQALLVDAPAHGQVTLQPDGAFTYTPALNYNGSDSFSYHASDGSSIALALVTLTIQAVDDAPAAHAEWSTPALEGAAVTFTASLVDQDDGSLAPISASAQIEWTFGDGQTGSGASAQHTYAGDGAFHARLRIDDPLHGLSEYAFDVTVGNQPPHIAAIADQRVWLGSPLQLDGSFDDPGAQDSWTAWVDYGDGAGLQSLALSGKTFALQHSYAQPGSYTVSVRVEDGDGGSHQVSFGVLVRQKLLVFLPLVGR